MWGAVGKPRSAVFLYNSQMLSLARVFAGSDRKRQQQQNSLFPRLLGQIGCFKVICTGNAAQPAFVKLGDTSARNFYEMGEKKEVFPQK